MVEVFNGGDAELTSLWLVGAALVALAGCLAWKMTGRKLAWFLVVVILVVGVFGGIAPCWDQLRIRAKLASGDDLRVTRGPIAQIWHREDRVRDYTSNMHNNYRTIVSEGFDVGAQRFSWTIGGCLSPGSLCELARSRLPLAQGTMVEVTWFADPAQQDEPRIIRLIAQPSS